MIVWLDACQFRTLQNMNPTLAILASVLNYIIVKFIKRGCYKMNLRHPYCCGLRQCCPVQLIEFRVAPMHPGWPILAPIGHVRVRVFVPFPQLALHSPQVDHSFQVACATQIAFTDLREQFLVVFRLLLFLDPYEYTQLSEEGVSIQILSILT